MSLETFVAGRYLRARRAESFISVIAGFSLVGIALGVATLIIVMSVMNGFRHELVGRILGLNGHISVFAANGPLNDYAFVAGQVAGVPGVVSATPVAEGQALVTRNGAASGVVVRGLSFEDLKNNKRELYDAIDPADRAGFKTGQIYIGVEMARRLGLRVGDNLALISPKPKNTPFGSMPRSRNFRVGGVFDVGMFEYNNAFVFMNIDTAQSFFNMTDRATLIEVVTANAEKLDDVRAALQERLDSTLVIRDWRDNNSNFFNALQVERNVMFLILTLIILVAAFNIISSLIMLVKDKSRDIAILRTFGADKMQILRIFLLTGASIGVVGTLVGFLLGALVTLNLPHIQHGLEKLVKTKLFPPEIYFLSQLPAIIDWREVAAIIVMALFLSFGATLYPAWRAAKLDPVEALRHG